MKFDEGKLKTISAYVDGRLERLYADYTGVVVAEGNELALVWLMLEMYPDDAAAIRLDQEVQAEVQSLPGEKFTGHVAFIDPQANPTTRTVGEIDFLQLLDNWRQLLRYEVNRHRLEASLRQTLAELEQVVGGFGGPRFEAVPTPEGEIELLPQP